MIALTPLLFLGGVVFVEQPIDSIYAAPDFKSGPWTNELWIGSRAADIDGDGLNDLLTDEFVAFQRDGSFPKTQQVAWPSLGDWAWADVWGNEVFVLLRDRIEVFRWAQGEWQRTLSQPIAWNTPARSTAQRGLRPPGRPALHFTQFLHDVNNDGAPEIVQPGRDGLHVYVKEKLFYEEKAVWPVLPAMRPLVSAQTLWPENKRAVAAPELAATATFLLEKNTLKVFARESIGNISAPMKYQKMPDGKVYPIHSDGSVQGKTQFKESVYTVKTDGTFAIATLPDIERESALVPRECELAPLNADDTLDLVCARYIGTTSMPYPTSRFEVAVSTDGGHTFDTAQSTGMPPRRVLIDYDGNGRLDMATKSIALTEGGIKETLVRGLTRREVDLDVEIRLQDDKGRFPVKPSLRRRFTIELDKPPANQSQMFLRFLDGDFLQLNGDVDGDGICDAVIHDRPGTLSVYKGATAGITSNRIATLPIDPGGWFCVADVDKDGKADVLTNREKEYRIDDVNAILYLSREGAPQ